MDPISVTASAIAFIGACRGLIAAFDKMKDVSRAPEDIMALKDELTGLQHTLTAVDLIARNRQDDVLEVLLSPLFHRVHYIIEELCRLSGLSARRLREDEYAKHLKFRGVARFKWVRDKERVENLRDRLKVARLDFANQMAIATLLNISNLSAEFKTVSSESVNPNQGALPITTSGDELVSRATMHTTTVSKQIEIDLEAQSRREDQVAQRTHVSKAKPMSEYKSFGGCKRACSCACHSVYRLKSPYLLHKFTGTLLIKSNGLYGMTQRCNESSCRRNPSASIYFSYRFPEWFLNRMISSIVISNQLSGPQVSLIAPRVVSCRSEIFVQAFAGNVNGIAALFERGLASPYDVSDDWGFTPLHYAVDKGHMDLCRFLLKAGARPEITDLDDNSVTDLVYNKINSRTISYEDAAALEEMFKREEWFEERQFSILPKIVLDLFPIPRDLDQELSASTKDIDLADCEGRTPLSWAAELGNYLALRTLLSYGANVSSKSITGMTPLHYAVKAPTPTGLLMLLENGALAIAKNKWNQSPLNLASYFQDDPAYIAPLLDAGVDVNEKDCGGSSALHCASFMNNVRTVRYLVSRGANINAQDRVATPALNDSIRNNAHECLSLLLELGPDLALKNDVGETALHLLARHADVRTLEMCETAEIEDLDADAENKDGLTAWDLLRQRVEVSEEVQKVFASLMKKLESKNICPKFFDAAEKICMSIEEASDFVEVRVVEVLAE